MNDSTGGAPTGDPAGSQGSSDPRQPERPERPEQPGRREPPAYGQYAPGPAGPGAGGPAGRLGGQAPRPAGGAPGGRPVTLGEGLGWAFSSYARSAGAWIGATLVVLAIAMAAAVLLTPGLRDLVANAEDPDALTDLLTAGTSVVDLLLSAVLSAVDLVLASVLVHGALAATRSGHARFADFFVLRNVGGIVTLGVIEAAISFVLAFVPFLGALASLVVGFFLAAALFFVVDKEQDAVTAIRSSVTLVRAHVGLVLATIIVAGLLALLGFLLFFVGALVTVPVAVLTGACVYRRLVGEQVAPPS